MTTATEARPAGHIHAGKEITPGGRYDRLLSFLRAHPGATTREIMLGADVCAVSAIVSELRQMGYDIGCEFAMISHLGGRIHRYTLNQTAVAPVAQPGTRSAGEVNRPNGDAASPAVVMQMGLFS